MRYNSFPYSFWVKILGLIVIVTATITFFATHHKKGVWDFNELAVGISWGLLFVFFSKEKTDDEMIQSLKFRALAVAIISAFSITHLYNYIFLNWRLERSDGIFLSISAYQFLALTLLIATACFYYLRYQVTSIRKNEK